MSILSLIILIVGIALIVGGITRLSYSLGVAIAMIIVGVLIALWVWGPFGGIGFTGPHRHLHFNNPPAHGRSR